MDAPLVPRTSKQAKMLGVALDDLDRPTTTSTSTSSNPLASSTASRNGASPGSGTRDGSRPSTSDRFLDGRLDGASVSRGSLDTVPSWSNNPASEVRLLSLLTHCFQWSRADALSPTHAVAEPPQGHPHPLVEQLSASSRHAQRERPARLRREGPSRQGEEARLVRRPPQAARQQERPAQGRCVVPPLLPSRSRRRSLLPRALAAGYSSEAAASVSEFGLGQSHGPPPPSGFDASTLPAKLQARGDATDTGANLATATQLYPKPPKAPKKSRRPTTPISALVAGATGGSSSRGPSTQGRDPAQRPGGAVYSTTDGDIALDTNFEHMSMEGIVAGDPSSSASVAALGGGPARGSLSSGTGSGSVGSATDAGYVSSRKASDGQSIVNGLGGAGAGGAGGARRPSLGPSAFSHGAHTESPTRHHHGTASAVNFWGSGSSSAAAAAQGGASHFGGSGGRQRSAAGRAPGDEYRPPTAGSKAASVMGFGVGAQQPVSPGGGTLGPGGGLRPGLGSRQGSTRSISTITGGPPPGTVSGIPRGSVFGLGGGAGGGAAVGGAAGSSGAWTAPDSWAVKAEAGASLDHDSSDDDDEDEDDDLETEESEAGASPGIGADASGVRPFGESVGPGMATRNGRPATSGSRSAMRGGRPGTADGEGRKASQKPVRPCSRSLSLFFSQLHEVLMLRCCSSWSASSASTAPSRPSPSRSARARPR